jgi:hypothetical protein
MKFMCGVAVGLALAATAAWAMPTISGNGILLYWTVTGDGHPGSPRVEICTDPTIEPFDKIIECHLNAPRPKTR